MNRKTAIALIVLLLLIAAAWLLWPRDGINNSLISEVETLPVIELAEEIPSYHAVSLPALMQKEFDGRDLKLGEVLAENAIYTRYYISYKSGELTISGIMNIPKGSGPFPVLILNHGYIDPKIYTNGRGLKREQDYLARQGFIVLHPDYRNHAQSDKDPEADVNFRLGYVEDVINVVYAIKNSSLLMIDKNNIGMLGHSMGGGVTLNILVTQPELVKAAVLFAPVSGDNRDNFKRWTKTRPETAAKVIEKYGEPASDPEFWDNVSSRTFLENITAPILLHHGTADKDVPVEWSNRLAEELKEKNKSVDYRVYEGQPHEFTSDWPAVMKSTAEFFTKHLKQRRLKYPV